MRNTTILRGAAQALNLEVKQIEQGIEQLTLSQLDEVIELLSDRRDAAAEFEVEGKTVLVEIDKSDRNVEVLVTEMEGY